MRSQKEINLLMLKEQFKNAPKSIKKLLKNTETRLEIENGWIPLIDRFLQKFEEMNTIGLTIAVIKQKFASLRIQLHVPNHVYDSIEELSILENIHNEIRKYEEESDTICELCGIVDDTVEPRAPRFWRWNCCQSCYEKKCQELKVQK